MSTDLAFFVDLESQVWQALVDGDAAADARFLSNDFLGVYPSGFSRRDDHAGQLDGGPTVTSYQLSQEQITVVADDAVLLSYRCDFVRPSSPETLTWYVSSLWCLRDDRWVNTFSQDTPADD